MTVIDRLERCSSLECLAMILAAMPSYPIASAYKLHAQGVTTLQGGVGGWGLCALEGFECPEGERERGHHALWLALLHESFITTAVWNVHFHEALRRGIPVTEHVMTCKALL